MTRYRRSAAALLLGAVAVAVFGVAAPASAHVTVSPEEATQGEWARLAFRVPNESDTAATTKLEVVLPEDAPVASVSTMPVAGWTVATEKRKLSTPLDVEGSQISEAVSKITWTATGGAAIKPGQFQEFPVSLGPLPKVDRMVFKALQTYSDGNVVRWIEEPPANGGEEPASPAPVLRLVAATASATPSGAPAGQPGARADDADDAGEDGDGPALALSIVGLVVGLTGLGLGAVAFARTRRSAPPTA
jgi:periplasmic copper chaperone A